METDNQIVPGRETVVRRSGADWSFSLPYRHEIEVDPGAGFVQLRTPDTATMYQLGGIEEADEEVMVKLGPELARSGPPSMGDVVLAPLGYPLPEIQDEFDRLTARYEEAGLPAQEVHAYAQGSTHEDQLRWLRKRLRDAGQREG
jgi:hypothetical protein